MIEIRGLCMAKIREIKEELGEHAISSIDYDEESYCLTLGDYTIIKAYNSDGKIWLDCGGKLSFLIKEDYSRVIIE